MKQKVLSSIAWNLLFELASLYEEMQEYEKCEDVINEALLLDPENPIFLNF